MARSRATHRGAGLTEKQDKFMRLIAQGVSNSEACRLVGIHRRTGTRWRLGRTVLNTAGEKVHYPPVSVPPAPRERHPRYLSVEERTAIADLRREKKGVREIAAAIGRSPATVSRELRRNADGSGRYLPSPRIGSLRSELLVHASDGCSSMSSSAPLSTSCSASGGAPSRSPMSCMSGSPASRIGSYAPSRSTRPSTTPTSRSPARPSGAVVAGGVRFRGRSGVVD